VPFLRDLVLNAEDETVEVEVEVDDETENDVVDHQSVGDCGCDGQNDINPESIDPSENKNSASTKATGSVDDENESAAEATKLTKKTVIQTEHRPISQALRALQQTFRSLTPSSGQSVGSTQALCRSLGINPYIQQDGQEFWKLFIPEVNYSKLTQLYTGYYDDYIRELIPQISIENEFWEEKKDDDDLVVRMEDEEFKPRERVRTDPFLDLSIPVTEGTG
jgi:ubiquitin carboxyl-terminal hydrolase 7